MNRLAGAIVFMSMVMLLTMAGNFDGNRIMAALLQTGKMIYVGMTK